MSHESSALTASTSMLGAALVDVDGRSPPTAPPTQSSPRERRTETAEPASTYSATLEFRDGRYDFVLQLVPSTSASAQRTVQPTASKLRVWLTRVSAHPLLAAAHAGPASQAGQESWTGEFSHEYIESMTRKTGNFKKFGVFTEMLVSGLSRSSSSVHIDLLSLEDLQRLRQHKSSPFPLPKPTSNKRYLILSYMAAFDRVHYPLPLSHVPQTSEPTTLLDMVRLLQDDNLQLTNELQSMHLQLRQEQDQRRIYQKQKHAACNFENELAILQEELSMISELLLSVQEEAHMWRERYNEVVRETRQTAAIPKQSTTSSHGVYPRPRQPSTESRQSSQSRYSAPALASSSPRSRRASNQAAHLPPRLPPTAARHQTQQHQPWKRDFSAERQHNNLANKRKTMDLPGYVPIRSAPLRSSGYGSPPAAPSPRRTTQPFRRFDPTEWARQRAERLQSPSVSPSRSWVHSSVSPARSSAGSQQRNSRVPSAGSSPARSTTSYRPDRSDWTPRGSPVRSSGYGSSAALHHSRQATSPQRQSPLRKPQKATRTPLTAQPTSGYGQTSARSSPRRLPEKSLVDLVNGRNEDRGYLGMNDRGHKGGGGTAGGGEMMDTNEIQERLNRLAERLRKAREQMR